MSKESPTKFDLLHATRQEMGFCVSCGHTRSKSGHTLCQLCLDMRTARSAETIARHLANSACTRCGGARDRANYRTCSNCAARDDKSRKEKLKQRLEVSPSMCPKCGIRPRGDKFARCDICLVRGRKYRMDRKDDIINGYGGKCVCCGETEPQFLTVDHIEGGGGVHRQTLGSNQMVYTFIRSNNYPPEFQLMCFNCNSAKGAFGMCPHERDRQKAIAREVVVAPKPSAATKKCGRGRHHNNRTLPRNITGLLL